MLPERETKEFKEYLADISKQNNAKRHPFYDESVKYMNKMGIHVTGDDPKILLDIRRPNETSEAKDYRLKSYKPKTKASASRVISVINRIYNERLFDIQYKEEPAGIKPENGFKMYMTEEMPLYVSFMNYIKSVFTKMHMKDANGLLIVQPLTKPEDTEYFAPIPIFVESENLVDFEDNVYYTLYYEKNKDNYGLTKREQKIVIIDEFGIETYFRNDATKDFELVEDKSFTHNFGFPCAFRVGGVVAKTTPPQLYESFISGVLPHWDDALCMFSDLQAAVVNHVYPESYVWSVDCDDCSGGGKIAGMDAHGHSCDVPCQTCSGTGRTVNRGPFNEIHINRDAINPEAALPIPPKAYIDKELASTELLEKLAEKEIMKGYEAINMDILNNVGEDQSGVAKTIDRQDLDGFLEVYASHMFKYVIPQAIYLIGLWRYGGVTDIDEYMPNIKAPTTFDVYSIQLLTEEFARLKESGVKGSFLLGIQKDIADKRFSDEKTKAFYNTIIDVDPLAHLTEDEILSNSRVIGDTDLVIHVYAKDLVEQAMDTNKDFLSLDLKAKKDIIRRLADARKLPVIEPEPENEFDTR